jgi:hypothetical protein
MECRQEDNLIGCTCTYEPCANKGICCRCIAEHRRHNELPGCVFPPEVERTYDRSYARFIATYRISGGDG